MKLNIKTIFTFQHISEDEVKSVICGLPPKSSFGIDGISTYLLKFLAPLLWKPLTLIINQSLNSGIFPDKLKIAKIVPVYKKEDKHLIKIYRPISILPAISKVFEKIVYNQLYKYFNNNNYLYGNQYSFRKSHSTELAAFELSDGILFDLDIGNTPLAIYLYLSKAFDTLNHSILLKKLQINDADKTSLAWFNNYLSNRHHFVEIENVKSNLVTLDLGVLQGSILGPLLFIIYVNDIYHSSDFFNFILYADDTSLYNSLFRLRNVTSDDINRELQKIYFWLYINKLSLNISKSKYMIFHHSRRKIEQNTLNLKLHNIDIERVTSFKFLGIVFDENLTWKYHISMITKSISRSVGILCKLKHYVPIYVLKILYNSLIVAHINYGLLVWGYNNKQIVLLQKKLCVL